MIVALVAVGVVAYLCAGMAVSGVLIACGGLKPGRLQDDALLAVLAAIVWPIVAAVALVVGVGSVLLAGALAVADVVDRWMARG